jgi:RNA polymerase sigma factor (sigma-70 family)
MAQSNRHNRCRQNIGEQLWGEVLKALPEQDARVVRLRYGLEGGPPLTIGEVAKVLCLSRERVRQIEAKVLRKMEKAVPQKDP